LIVAGRGEYGHHQKLGRCRAVLKSENFGMALVYCT
jgi:hypothetical protein